MKNLSIFLVVLAALFCTAAARIALAQENQLAVKRVNIARRAGESSEETLDLEKLSQDDKKELQEWADKNDITWTQIEALSQFTKEVKEDEKGEKLKEHVKTVCKTFDTKPQDNVPEGQRELAILGQTVQILSLYQKLLTTDEDREVFVILRDMCHVANNIEALTAAVKAEKAEKAEIVDKPAVAA